MMTAWSRFPLGGVEAEARRREKEKQEGDQETELGGGRGRRQNTETFAVSRSALTSNAAPELHPPSIA